MFTETENPISAEQIPQRQRITALPQLFGNRCTIVESAIFNAASNVITGYKGAYWEFYRCSNGAFFMAPVLGRPNYTGAPGTGVTVEWAGNCYKGEMSEQAAGIVCCMHAYSHLSCAAREGAYQDALVDQFHKLREYVSNHPEAAAILAAID